MKQIKRRSYAALILALALIAGLGLYVYRFAAQGKNWVNFSANQNLFQGGRLVSGTVKDRNGLVLADVADGKRVFAEDAELRAANLHAVGDAEGNIGAGALVAFADTLGGYDPVGGVAAQGGTVTLTVDAELNKTAYQALTGAGLKGAVLVSDYTTGEILCMTSSPGYDPTVGFDPENTWFDGVWLNRGLSAAYTPGSVFKLVTMAAAIDTIPELYDRSFTCEGTVTVEGHVIHCTGVHGQQTVEQALANSCNVAFAELSLELGGEILSAWAKRAGLTEALKISGVVTAAGQFDAFEDDTAALAWSGIGQATDLVCPAALLRYVSAIANGGTAAGPVLRLGESGPRTRLLPEPIAGKLKEMMSYNVNVSYGAWNFPGLNLCAKSGTAEVGDGTSHAWFTGFLDDPEHPYAFVVVAEHGGSGVRTAGAIANTVLQATIAE